MFNRVEDLNATGSAKAETSSLSSSVWQEMKETREVDLAKPAALTLGTRANPSSDLSIGTGVKPPAATDALPTVEFFDSQAPSRVSDASVDKGSGSGSEDTGSRQISDDNWKARDTSSDDAQQRVNVSG